jgi:hypothetical protein
MLNIRQTAKQDVVHYNVNVNSREKEEIPKGGEKKKRRRKERDVNFKGMNVKHRANCQT